MSANLEPNLEMAQRFLDLLDEQGEFTFQTFSDRKELKVKYTDPKDGKVKERDPNARVFHGTLAEHAAKLTLLNQLQVGIYVMVNAGDGKRRPGAPTCRTADNVIRLRAHMLDLDGSPLDPVLATKIQPHIIVQSSTGKWHVYWKIAPQEISDDNRDEWKRLYKERQLALAKTFNGDEKVTDLCRVLRLPGFYHHKADPVMVHLLAGTKSGDISG